MQCMLMLGDLGQDLLGVITCDILEIAVLLHMSLFPVAIFISVQMTKKLGATECLAPTVPMLLQGTESL